MFNRVASAFGKLLQLIAIMGIMRPDVFHAPSLLARRRFRRRERYSGDFQRFSLDLGQCTKIRSISVMIIQGRSIKASWLLQDFQRV